MSTYTCTMRYFTRYIYIIYMCWLDLMTHSNDSHVFRSDCMCIPCSLYCVHMLILEIRTPMKVISIYLYIYDIHVWISLMVANTIWILSPGNFIDIRNHRIYILGSAIAEKQKKSHGKISKGKKPNKNQIVNVIRQTINCRHHQRIDFKMSS